MDSPLRRWDVRHTLTRMGIRAGETVLELGPGPGVFTVDAADTIPLAFTEAFDGQGHS